MVMLQELDSGTKLRLKSGATVEVTDNPRDGSWVYVRYLNPPPAPGADADELVFAEDVVDIVD